MSVGWPRRALAPSGVVAALVAVSTVAACGGAAPQTRRFLSLAPDAPAPARVAAPPTLRVRELDCAPPYDQVGVVFRISPVEVRAYRYNNWSAVPGVMVAEVLRRYLAASGRFNLVDEEDQADLELGGRVDALEQVAEGGRWFGRVELSLTLRRTRDGRIVWRQRIDGVQPAEGEDVAEVVAAHSRVLATALDQELESLAAAADQAVAGPPAGAARDTGDE
jgi:ABC-type uncharacterized transport system auxiliary subunit